MFIHRTQAALTFAMILVSGLLLPTGRVQAVTWQGQQDTVVRLREQLKEASTLIVAGKLDDAARIANTAQTEIASLTASATGNARQLRRFETLLTRLEVIRRVLDRKGTQLAAWPAESSESTISFSADIVPIFIAKCNNCHVRGNRGGFSMANYQALMRGSGGGIVVRPNNVTGSRLVDVLETGDMPRGGTMTADEIQSIKTWISEGARFDGSDSTTALAQLAQPEMDEPSNTEAIPAPEFVRADGDEEVLFSRDIAPVIVEQCLNCHGGNNASAQLGLGNFTRVLRGGQSGPIIASGKPEGSLLIRKLKGTADGQRMPLQRPPLTADVIAKFEAWIADGAKFDGPAAATPTTTVAQLFRISQLSFDELSAERVKTAEQIWRTAHPNVTPNKFESERFLLLGTVNEGRLEEFAAMAEQSWTKIAQTERLQKDDWPLGGRVTLFVFDRRFEYSEFGRMVERRTVPRGGVVSRRYTTEDAYVAILADEDEEDIGRDRRGRTREGDKLAPVITEQLAAIYYSSFVGTPDWFRNGFARQMTARLYPGDSTVSGWVRTGLAARVQLRNPASVLNGNLPADSAAALEYDFAAFLAKNSGGLRNLIRALRKQTPFAEAFQKAYGATPAQAAEVWKRQ
ncbi:MAG: hypothetical protein MPJ50_13465 [Pirellulales bacterium]|nr:hypothetical protein [Pirellulales bacterium]